MMSFGIGDAIAIITLLTQTYQSCSAAPSKIKDAYTQTRTIHAHLTIISNEYPQHEATLSKNEKLSTHFSQTIDCLKRDLRALHKLIRKWKKGLWGDKGWFILTDMSDVMRLREELAEHNQMIHLTILPHLRWETDRAAKRESAKRHSKQAEALEAEFARLRKEVARERKKAWSRERKLLRELIKLRGQSNINTAAHSNDAGAWDAVEADLTRTRRDVSREEAKKILEPYKEEIRACQLDKAPKGREVDGKKTSERKKPKTDGDKKKNKKDQDQKKDEEKDPKTNTMKKDDGGKKSAKEDSAKDVTKDNKPASAKKAEADDSKKPEKSAGGKKENERKAGETKPVNSKNEDTRPKAVKKNIGEKANPEKKTSGSSAVGKTKSDSGIGKSDAKQDEANRKGQQNGKEKVEISSKASSPSPNRGRLNEKAGKDGKTGGLLQVPGAGLRSRSVPPQQSDDIASVSSGRTRAGSTSGLSRSNSTAGSSVGRSDKSGVGAKGNKSKT